MTYGFIVPEDEVARVLRAAQADLRAAITAGTIDDYLARMFANLDDGRRAEIQTWFEQNGDPRIVYGYPHEAQVYPSFNLIIDGESLSKEYVGNAGFVAELDTGEHVIVSAQRWTSSISVVAGAEGNADLVRWLYQFAKFSLSSARRDLARAFPHGVRFSGQDLRPLEIPHAGRLIFRRALNLSVEYDQTDADRFDVGNITGLATESTVQP